jgi:aconitate hydratase
MNVDLYNDALGTDKDGKPVFMKDIWPTQAEVADIMGTCLDRAMFQRSYANVFAGDDNWNGLKVPAGEIYEWDPASTYVKNPPYFEGMTLETEAVEDIRNARVLALLGDSVTTDHISPAGNISKDSPAARYLIEQGVAAVDFNSYGSRRGNHEVMMRGTFANIRLRNQLAPGTEGGWTVHIPSGEQTSIYEGAMRYKDEGVPLVVIAGKEYGTGSSRDWAAKGTKLLGVQAVIAESFERIHRSNLIGMGVLPLQFREGENAGSLGLTGHELISIEGLDNARAKEVTVVANADDGKQTRFKALVRIDTPKEREYYLNGGILHYVLRQLAKGQAA